MNEEPERGLDCPRCGPEGMLEVWCVQDLDEHVAICDECLEVFRSEAAYHDRSQWIGTYAFWYGTNPPYDGEREGWKIGPLMRWPLQGPRRRAWTSAPAPAVESPRPVHEERRGGSRGGRATRR